MRGWVLCCLLGIILGTGIGTARAEALLSTAIAAQPLPSALAEFAQQTGLQLIYVSKDATGHASGGAAAGLSATAALTQLLDGTGLHFEFLNSRTVRIYAANIVSPAAQASSTDTPQRRAPSFASIELEDIVVVGLRDEQGLNIHNFVQNVPASVAVVSGDTLESQKFEQLTDYANYIPGLNVAAGGSPGQALVALRGVAALTEGTTVGYYLDDVPMGPSGGWARGCCLGLDLTPYDIDRLEVLRGPQGTIYGGAGEAGIIRYVLKLPNVTDYEARIGADTSWLQGASAGGVGARMELNAPLVPDVLGLRVSAFEKYTPGYLNNLRLDATDVNDYREYGGRIATLWQPAPSLSVKLNAIWYGVNAASDAAVSSQGVVIVPNTGNAFIVAPQGFFPDLTENNHFLQPFAENLRLFSATVKWSEQAMDLVSVSAWSATHTHYILDTTPVFGGLSGQPSIMDRQVYLGKFSEELRLLSPQGRRIDWTLGAFFTHEVVGDHPTDDDPITLLDINYPSWAREWAVFGDLTWRLTTRLELTAGIRYAHTNEQQVSDVGYEGVLYSGTPPPGPEAHTAWLVNAGFHITPEVMLYGRIATGYAQGGQSQPGRDGGLPGVIYPDALTNYEIGVKSEFLEHRLLANLSLFYITRRNVLLGFGDFGPDFLTNSGAESTWNINGGAAVSKGAEFTGFYSPLVGLKVGYSAAYTQSELTNPALNVNNVPGPQFLSGYQLPNIPRWTASVTTDYEWQLDNAWSAHAGAAFRWVSWEWASSDGVQNLSPESTPAVVLPSYGLLDLNAGMKKDKIALNIFMRNVANKRAYLGGGVSDIATNVDGTAFKPVQVNYAITQPRTVGIGFDYSFR